MKRSKKVLVLLSVLAAACLATVILGAYEKKQEQIKVSESIILQLPSDTVTAVSWDRGGDGDEMSFSRTETGWSYDNDEAFPVSEEKMNELLSHFEAFTSAFAIENAEDYSLYGLDDPETVISLEAGEEIYEIKLGDYSTMDAQRYVDIGDGMVYLVSDDPVEFLPSGLSGLILHDRTGGFEKVSDIVFSGSADYTVVRQEDSGHSYSDEDIYYALIDGEYLPLNSEYVQQLLNTVSSLELFDYVSYNASEEELEKYGLAEPELSTTVNYSYTDDQGETQQASLSYHIGCNTEEKAAAEKAEADGEEEIPDVTKYIRIGDSGIIYTLDDVDYMYLADADYNDLRHRETVWASDDMISGLDIYLEDTQHFLSTEGVKNEEGEPVKMLYKDQETEVDEVLSSLRSVTAKEFTADIPEGMEELRLRVYLADENFPQVDISFYRHDGQLCLAQVNGVSFAYVERAAVMRLVEDIQEIVLGGTD